MKHFWLFFVYLVSNQNHVVMNLQEFKKLEKLLGHPPTEKEVREHQAKKNELINQIKASHFVTFLN